MSLERRISRDGGEYTEEEFLEWYGRSWGHQYWQAAMPAGAPQPGGQGAAAPQAAVASTTATALPATGTGGAIQPAGGPWEGSVFLTQTLQEKQDTLRRELPQLPFSKTPREAMDQAYSLADYLPLRVQAFADFDILPALAGHGGAHRPATGHVVAVVAEKIPRVPDNNRMKDYRIDFFVYYSNGDVVRHHPGRTANSSMRPHCMPSGSALFSRTQAQEIGVGASLHLHPPGRAPDAGAPQPGAVLTRREDVDQCCVYDIQMWSWRRVREFFLQPMDENAEIDISDGHMFPWWLFLGGTGKVQPLIERGITRVAVSGRRLQVNLLDGHVALYSSRHARMELSGP